MPGVFLHRNVACRVTGQLSAVFGGIRNVASVLDDVLGVGDEGSTVFDITEVSDLSFLASSAFDDALRVVDGTRKDEEAKREQWVIAKVWVNESIPTYIGPWALLCDSSRPYYRAYMAGDIVTFAFLASETTDFDCVSDSGCDRWGVHLCGCGVRLLAGSGQHRRSPDRGG